ncbi:isochorismatase family protein [Leptospira interrogans]
MSFEAGGYGEIAIGWGKRPAVIVVDFQLAFTDPTYPLGQSGHIHAAVEQTAKLLAFARANNVPVASCRTAWCGEKDMILWKASGTRQGMFHGDRPTEMDPRIYDASYDVNFVKAGPSIFFGTPLVSYLIKSQIDTVIVTGCTTSGCVRASIIDCFSYGFRTIVPEDCVGDMGLEAHRANLLDVGRRYADVVDAKTCMSEIRKLAAF